MPTGLAVVAYSSQPTVCSSVLILVMMKSLISFAVVLFKPGIFKSEPEAPAVKIDSDASPCVLSKMPELTLQC